MEQPEQDLPVVAIIGAGIAGLAAAFFLRDEPVRVVVLEGSPQAGGKLSLAEVAGCRSTWEPRPCWPAGPRAPGWSGRPAWVTT